MLARRAVTAATRAGSVCVQHASASTPAAVRPGCVVCTSRPFALNSRNDPVSVSVERPPSGHYSFSSTTAAQRSASRGGSSSKGPYRPRRHESDSQRPNHAKDEYIRRQRERMQFKFEGFGSPNPPTGQEVARQLVDQIVTLRDDDKLPGRLYVYGLKGRAAQLLRHKYDSELAVDDVQKTNSQKGTTDAALEDVRSLFEIWAEQAKNVVPQLGRRYDASLLAAKAQQGASQAGAELAAADPSAFRDINSVVSSYTIEGKGCLSRFCIAAFFDWIQQGLTSLLHPPSSTDISLSASDVEQVSLTASQLHLLRKSTDLRLPVHRYPIARTLTRQIHLHVGPTNSGKTHGALVALSKARTGVFAGPLRLLAHEVWDRFNSGTISPGVAARACNLITGEEQRMVDVNAGLYSCTVEMVSLRRAVDVAVVDEIQMIGDPQRGYAWTSAVLGIPAKEIHLCGEASTLPLIRRLAEACGDVLTVHEYKRLTPLTIADQSLNDDLTQIRRGDCIVSFSRSGIFDLKREIESKTGLRCAVAYGALPPETKSEQAKLFNEGKLDVMVASDAIGMGLNLKIKRVIFESMSKWNGKEQIVLSASQIKQIAGRAGRYGTKRADDESDGGMVTTRHQGELDILRQALDSPLRPVDRAALHPSSETLASMAAMLPPTPRAARSSPSVPATESASSNKDSSNTYTGSRTLSEIYTDVSLLSRIDSTTYFMSDFSQQHQISPLVESASRSLLTVAERETFANAPASTRDERVMAFLSAAVRQFSLGGLVHFDDCADDLGMLEIEQLTTEAIAEARRAAANAQRSDAKSAIGKETPPLAGYLATDHPLLNVTTLMLLESLHRCMSLYLWLSFRFPLAFCHRAAVETRKRAMEDGIEFVLEGIRFGRARRLRALGRTEEAEKVFQKPAWKQSRQQQEQEQQLRRLSDTSASPLVSPSM